MMNTKKYDVIILNQDFSLVDICSIERGCKLFFNNKVNLYGNKHITIKSINNEYKITSILILKKYVNRTIKNNKNQRVKVRGINPSRKNVFLRDKNVCQYCKKRFIKSELTLDHIIPKSRKDILEKSKIEVNSWENLATCCKKCNGLKDNKTDLEFIKIRLNMKPLKITDLFYDFDETILKND